MLGRVWLRNASNGRVAWVLTAGVLAAILAMPSPASAQVDAPNGANQNRPGPGGPRPQPPQPTRDRVDILNLRDASNTMVIAAPPAMPGSEPLTVNAVVCLAGCNDGQGTIVYRDRPMPTLASLTGPVPSTLTQVTTAGADTTSLGSGITCLAGCYEPPARRTVASLRLQHQAKAPAPVQRTQRAIAAAPAAPAPVAALEIKQEPATEAAAADVAPAPSKPVKLRAAFGLDGSRKLTRNARAKTRIRHAAKRTPQYGKIVSVPQDKQKAISAPAEPVATSPVATTDVAPAPAPEPRPAPTPPVTTFTPPPKTEKKRTAKSQPVATVSNDWFNKINRQRKDEAAAKQQSEQ